MSRKHILFIIAALFVPLVVLITSQRHASDDDATEPPTVAQHSPQIHIQTALEAEPVQIVEPPKPSIAEVTQIVGDRNAENVKRLKEFEAEGWEVVKVDDPPDAEVMQLSLTLIGKREEDLQAQIQSNSFSSDMSERLTKIALTTKDEKTRYVALEALGRSGEKSAQLHLTEAYEQLADEETRSQILGYLTPAEPNDEIAIFLTEQIADPNTSDRLKTQAAFPLAMMSLLSTSTPEEAMALVSADMPDEWKNNFSTIVTLLAKGAL